MKKTKEEILNHIHVRMRFQSPFDLPVKSILEDYLVNRLSDLMCLDGLSMNIGDFKKAKIDIVMGDDGCEFFVYKKFKLLTADGSIHESVTPGKIGGHKKLKIYGELNCYSANNALTRGQYAQHRVFFKDEETAIAAGYRPCGKCMKEKYSQWKLGGTSNSIEYPWKILPKSTPK